MSQVKPPRVFKFVGGPSRKRRRPAALATREPPSPPAPQPIPLATATTARTRTRTRTRTTTGPQPTPAMSAQLGANSNIEADDRVRHSSSSTDDIQGVELLPAASVFGECLRAVPAVSDLPGPDEASEALLDWPVASDMALTMDATSLTELIDPDSFFRVPFPSHTFPELNLSHDGPPLDPSREPLEEYVPDDGSNSTMENVPSTDSCDSTEEIEREDDSELGGIRPALGGISESFSRLFAQYDKEFCVWPLTHDFDANPFRYDAETERGSPLLRHCILALSYKHIHRKTGSCLDEAKMYKRKALQLFEGLECDLGSPRSREILLDGLLILMTLDCATSAQGPWAAHLSRAQKIIEANECLNVQRTPRIQAQIDMLVWWDVTLGLTTRQGFVLSARTIESVFRSNTSSSFYNISGCPDELFEYMFRLGTYAREFELASHMTCVTFDMGPVLAVERAIKEWQAPQFDDPDVDIDQSRLTGLPEEWGLDVGQAAHYVQDLYHCAQAWRLALLVYIERVFRWRRSEASMTRLSFLARKALNNVSSCRRSVMIQKQLLLPVFLAASETDDENLRQEARDYCRWWGEETRYDMFITTLALLEEVWANNDQHSWWGSIVDAKSAAGSSRQYLFG